MDKPLVVGSRGHWGYFRYDSRLEPTGPAVVLTLHPRTAHIRYQRRDGRNKMRWVKLSRLRVVA